MLAISDQYIKMFLKYSLPILAAGIISRAFPLVDFIYYIVPVLLAIYALLALTSIKKIKINFKYFPVFFIFPFYCLLTSLWSVYPLITLQRSFYLILLYAGILSAVYLYKKYLPEKGIEFLIHANILIVVISLISLVLAIPENSWTGGNGLGFMGFAGHQNTLASAVMFTLPVILMLWRRNRKLKNGVDGKDYKSSHSWSLSHWNKKNFVPVILLLAANIILIVLTYSRAVLLAVGIGLLIYLILTKSYKTLSVGFLLIISILIMFFSIQAVNQSISQVLSKHGWDIFATRTLLWQSSVEAAKLGGVNGLGYGVSSPDIILPKGTGSYFKDNMYIREKGNSTLALIEETGVIGLILFIMPLVLVFKRRNDARNQIPDKNNLSGILFASLAAFILHAQFEAWWVGPGSIQFPMFLIFVGLIYSTSINLNEE